MSINTIIKMGLGISFAVICVFTTANAASLNFSQDTVDVKVSESFTLDIMATNFPQTFGGTILVEFDTSVIDVTNIELAMPFIGGSHVFTPPKTDAGLALLHLRVPANLDSLPSGDFVFATVELTALAEGTTDLLLGARGTYLFGPPSAGSKRKFIDFTSGSATVSVSAVPIPAALWLLLSGLIGLFTIARKKINKSEPTPALAVS